MTPLHAISFSIVCCASRLPVDEKIHILLTYQL